MCVAIEFFDGHTWHRADTVGELQAMFPTMPVKSLCDDPEPSGDDCLCGVDVESSLSGVGRTFRLGHMGNYVTPDDAPNEDL